MQANSHGSISVGQWGGPGGDPFSFRVGSWIKEIIVHEGTNISPSLSKTAMTKSTENLAAIMLMTLVKKEE